MKALKKFLKSKTSVVKFIASSVPMAPDSKSKNTCLTKIFDNSPQDRWEGHQKQRKEILDFIKKEKIKNVFFLSGDVHVSYAFDIVEKSSSEVIARQITSSAFNWGVGLNDCNFGKSQILLGTNGEYIVRNLTENFITRDNFCRVVLKDNEVNVQFYSAKSGESLRDVPLPIES